MILSLSSNKSGLSAGLLCNQRTLSKCEALVSEGRLEKRTRTVRVPALDAALVEAAGNFIGMNPEAHDAEIVTFHLVRWEA